MSESFRERLQRAQTLIADGAMGTMLQAAGLPAGDAPEVWNLAHPDRIKEVHQSYLQAGADVILTNSFGGSPFRLERAGLGERVEEVNEQAARIAREAVRDKAFVLGSLGPSGEMLQPLGLRTFEELKEAFARQAKALVEGSVDGLLLETMNDLGEAEAAIQGIRESIDLPLLASFSFDMNLRTMMGISPQQLMEAALEWDVDGFGSNCGRGPEEMEAVMEEMHQVAPDALLLAKPNAGLPAIIEGQTTYVFSPQDMARFAVRYVELGARIVGACCGSTPNHIRAMADAVNGRNRKGAK
jgi:5-methyltetrahydrofolate--homocysteine methyltransferase